MEQTQKNFVYLKNNGKNIAFNLENEPSVNHFKRINFRFS